MNRGNRTYNAAYHSAGAGRAIAVTLTCGCQTNVRSTPMNKASTYPCPSNQGHGYSVNWTSWDDGTRTGTNDRHKGE